MHCKAKLVIAMFILFSSAAKTDDYAGLPLPDRETMHAWLTEITAPEHRRAGSEGYHQGMDYIEARFKEFGLEQVTREPIDILVWEADKWSLTVQDEAGPVEVPCYYEWNTGFTGPQGLTAPMIYVGGGIGPLQDVKDKIVVAEIRLIPPNHFVFPADHWFSLYFDVYWEAYRKGAAGIVFILSAPMLPGYDNNTLYTPRFDPRPGPIPSLFVTRSDGEQLKKLARKKPYATLVLDGTNKPGKAYNVYGALPGRSEENIIISSHADAIHKGFVNSAGVVSVMVQAAAWARVPKEDRPKTLIFVATASHYYHCPIGSRTFANKHQDDLLANTLMLINLECAGAKKFEAVDGGLADTGEIETGVINYQGPRAVVKTMKKVLKQYPPAPKHRALRVSPMNDAGGYLETFPELAYVTYQAMPNYLLTSDDTLDKVDKEWLFKANVFFAELIKAYMEMPSADLSDN